MIEDSRVATAGTAESFLHATHVTKTRNAFQITACALYKLLKSAFDNEQLYSGEMDLCFEDWCDVKCKEQPTFKYWFMILSVILAYLDFVFFICGGLFETYTTALSSILPFLFANDNTHYSRWGSVHLNDMLALSETHRSVYREFMKGNFVFHESNRQFSGLALDQAHEHNNAFVKADGGVIGITENPSALLRWMTSGPQISQLIKDF